MVYNLGEQNSILGTFMAEIRDENIQKDSLRFRHNLKRVAMLLGYEFSKTLDHVNDSVETPLGIAEVSIIKDDLVICSVMRAGLPMHLGLLDLFDRAGNAFVAAYRMSHKDASFEINVDYINCPDLEGKILVITDPMLATGSSLIKTLEHLQEFGKPSRISIISLIASNYGIRHLQRQFPDIDIWVAAVDDELTGKYFIVPGLGDAGDLAFGSKFEN
jgi:uracil phosphoribosyltransferase